MTGDTHSETDFETESSASPDEFYQDEVEVLSSSSSTGDNEFEAVDHEEVLCGVASVNAAPVSSNNPHPCSESPAHSNPHMDPFVHFFCLFMSFQLCYKVSDCGLTWLLVFINVMLTWIATLIPSAYRDTIKAIKNKVPKNVYFLKKIFNLKVQNNSFKKYIVCPSCSALYSNEDLIPHTSSYTTDIPKCSTKHGRRKCNAMLLKKVKRGSKYALVPRRIYPYYSLKQSLSRLFNGEDFFTKCEHWRKRQIIPGTYLDINMMAMYGKNV